MSTEPPRGLHPVAAPHRVCTTCPYCGVGCGVEATLGADGAVAVRGDHDHPANHGRLCSKGAALGETLGRASRLLEPSIDGHPVDWDAALRHVAAGLARTIDQHGPDAIGFYVSGQLLSEDYYAANKLMKGFIGSANIDTNSRLCMASSVAGHVRAFGTDTVPGCYEDLELADLVVMTGSNAAWCHPVLWQRILAARRSRPGMRIVVIDPRATPTSEEADLHLPLRPGSDVMLFNGLLVHLSKSGALDTGYIAEHTEGMAEALAAATADAPHLDAVAAVTGLHPADIERFYGLFAEHERTVTCYSQGVHQSSSGTDKVNAILNCHLATGRIGRPGMGPFSLTGQPNAMGGREVGGLANQLAGHLRLENPHHRVLVQEFWQSPRVATAPGLKAVDLFRAVADGRIKALWIMATNPVVSLPDADAVRAALARCPLVIVSECVATNDTLPYAHVRLPALAWLEKDGTVTNSERRISRQRPLLGPAGTARADWWIVMQVARRMGWAEHFDWNGAADVFREHARLSAFRNEGETARDFNLAGLADLSDEAYEALAPVQWPVHQGTSAGTPRLFGSGGFFRSGSRAALVPVQHCLPQGVPGGEHPFVLNTGRVRDHWHTLTRTALSPRLSRHRPEPFLEMHPADIDALGLHAGQLARITSRWGSAIARVVEHPGQQPGSAFMPMHWSGALSSHGRVNAVVNPDVDPHSGQPELKHTPVGITSAGLACHGLLLCAPGLEGTPDVAYRVEVNAGGHRRWIIAGEGGMALAASDMTDALLGIALPPGARLARYDDGALGQHRRLVVDRDNKPLALLALWPEGSEPPGTDWWYDAFDPARPADAALRAQLLAASPGTDRPAAGPLVCACHGVGEGAILAAVQSGCASVEALGERTAAGTGCGSCRPELRRLLEAACAAGTTLAEATA